MTIGTLLDTCSVRLIEHAPSLLFLARTTDRRAPPAFAGVRGSPQTSAPTPPNRIGASSCADSIQLLVRRAAFAEPLLEVVVQFNETLGQIREKITSQPVLASEPGLHFVWAGAVLLDDTATAFQMGLQDGATLLVLRDEKAYGALRTELCTRRSSRLIVWRGLRADEETCDVVTTGLVAKFSGSKESLESAIIGGSVPSQFIFSSLDAVTAVYYAANQPNSRVVQIDTSKLPPNTCSDASDATKCEALGLSGTALDFAVSHQIVAIEGRVPPEAIIGVHEVAPLQVPRRLAGTSLWAYRAELSSSSRAAIQEWRVDGIRKFLANGGAMTNEEIKGEIESSRMYKPPIQSAMCAPHTHSAPTLSRASPNHLCHYSQWQFSTQVFLSEQRPRCGG